MMMVDEEEEGEKIEHCKCELNNNPGPTLNPRSTSHRAPSGRRPSDSLPPTRA